jgi:hypothetical protein
MGGGNPRGGTASPSAPPIVTELTSTTGKEDPSGSGDNDLRRHNDWLQIEAPRQRDPHAMVPVVCLRWNERPAEGFSSKGAFRPRFAGSVHVLLWNHACSPWGLISRSPQYP